MMIAACAEPYANPPYVRASAEPPRVLVVYYSRSGNTETMAQTIARYFEADLMVLEPDGYSLGLWGYLGAAWDSIWRRSARQVTPGQVDLAAYRVVFIGGPIWYWRPAPPLWIFVEQNDFAGATVIPFFTMKSDYSEEMARELEQRIEAKGGISPGHLALKHGDKRGEHIVKKTEALLQEHSAWWKGIAETSVQP